MSENIAERTLFSMSPDGQKKILRIAVGKPYPVDDVSWACPVEVEGLYHDLEDAVGIDSWQALSLAISLLRQLLRYYVDEGGKLFWEEGGEAVSLEELFPQFKGF